MRVMFYCFSFIFPPFLPTFSLPFTPLPAALFTLVLVIIFTSQLFLLALFSCKEQNREKHLFGFFGFDSVVLPI